MLIAHESGHLSYSLLDQVQVSLSITSVRPLLELCKYLCNNLLLSCHVQNDDENSISIYPSQRQNLLPTFEILIQNFENFQIY